MPDDIVLELSYADAAQVPEAFKGLYVEKDGTHNLNLGMFKGLKTEADVTNVGRALSNEKNAHKELKAKWGAFFGDKKPEDIQAILDRVPELEQLAASKGIDDNKLTELADQRARSKMAPLERQVQTLTASLAEKDTIIKGFQEAETRRTIHDDVRGFALKSKVVESAVEDVLMLAERVFEVSDDGKVVTKDGLNGIAPGLSPEVWLTEMQRARPHWWPPSSGGGGRGGGPGGGGFANNPWAHDTWNLTEQGKILTADRSKADQMAKAAGTVVGGARPMPPKR